MDSQEVIRSEKSRSLSKKKFVLDSKFNDDSKKKSPKKLSYIKPNSAESPLPLNNKNKDIEKSRATSRQNKRKNFVTSSLS